MKNYLIDVNLPRYFSLWNSDEYEFVVDTDDTLTDSEIWEYAKTNSLTIVTKDADFSERILLDAPPPRVIHIKFGNMKIRDFHRIMRAIWNDTCQLSNKYRLVRVYRDRIEGID